MPPTLPVMPGVQLLQGAARPVVTLRSISAGPTCWGSVAFADLIRFRGRRMGPATPGRHVQHAKHGAGIRSGRRTSSNSAPVLVTAQWHQFLKHGLASE